MKQGQYESLVSVLADRLLEEGPEVAAEDNEEGATTPPDPDKKGPPANNKVKSLVTGAVLGNADGALSLLNKAVGYHHFGSHAALRGETSGTGAK